MKATRKLIPAIAMLLISAVMMSTATFAWFSTNSSVTAEGMKISATAKNTFLIIADSEAELESPTYQDIKVDFAMDTGTELYPATYFLTAPSGANYTTENGSAVATGWYTAIANAPGASAAKEKTFVSLEESALVDGKYAIKKTVWVSVADNFAGAKNLTIESCTITDATDSANAAAGAVLVKSGSTVALCKKGSVDTTTIFATDITSASKIQIDIYFFIDGEADVVNSVNAINLKNIELTLKFKAEAAST